MFVIEQKPLFASLEQALFWAWYLARYEPGIVQGPSFAKMIKDDERDQIDDGDTKVRMLSYLQTDRRPEGLDAAAQAGMIKGFINAMALVEQAHLKARMLRATERSEAKLMLVAFVGPALPNSDIDGQLLYELISKHYGKRGVSIAGLAKQHKLDRRKLTAIRRQVEITLEAIANRAETVAYDKLQAMGVVA